MARQIRAASPQRRKVKRKKQSAPFGGVLTAEQFRELQKAIARAAVDRVLDGDLQAPIAKPTKQKKKR